MSKPLTTAEFFNILHHWIAGMYPGMAATDIDVTLYGGKKIQQSVPPYFPARPLSVQEARRKATADAQDAITRYLKIRVKLESFFEDNPIAWFTRKQLARRIGVGNGAVFTATIRQLIADHEIITRADGKLKRRPQPKE